MGIKPSSVAIAVSTILSFSIASAFAVESPTSKTSTANVDETIVVIGRYASTPLNIAANVDVIDSADIQMSGATNLTDLLRSRSGIQVADNNSGSTFSMRGFSASQAVSNTLILIDGRRLNNIDIAAPSIEAIPLNQIERVEILSGSAGVLYGDQAVGGVINIITKAPASSGGSVQLSAGSFDTHEAKADVGGAITDEWRYYLAGHFNESDNFRENNAKQTGSVLGRIQYKTAQDDFYVEGSYYDNDRQVPGNLSLDQFEDNPRQSAVVGEYSHEMTSAFRSGYTTQLSDTWSLGADVNYADSVTSSVLWGSPGRIEKDLLSFSPKAVGTYALAHGDLSIITGIDLSQGEADYDLAFTTRNNEQTVSSVYVQASVPLTNEFSYVVGGRYAKVTDDLSDVVSYPTGIELDNNAHAIEFGVNYRPTAAHRFYVRAEDNFRFAKVDEQAFTPSTVIGLNPQTGRSYEAGWDWFVAAHTLGLNVYRLDLEDEIVYDANRTDGPWGGGANINADESRRYGLSAKYDYQVAKEWLVGAEYNYIDAEFTAGENKDKALSWVAEHTARGYVSVDIDDNWQVFAESVLTGSRFMEGDNGNQDAKLGSYVLSNLAVNYSRTDWTASLRIDNILDENYVSAGYYSPWGNGYYSGTGRSLRLTAGYRF